MFDHLDLTTDVNTCHIDLTNSIDYMPSPCFCVFCGENNICGQACMRVTYYVLAIQELRIQSHLKLSTLYNTVGDFKT